MKKKKTTQFQLTENEVKDLIKQIVEDVNLEHFEKEDFVDVGLESFKNWLKQTHKVEILKYPMSYLVKKYLLEYKEYLNFDSTTHYFDNITQLQKIGEFLVKTGQYVLPSLREEGLFTEKFKKPLGFFLKRVEFPEYFKFNLVENNPYEITFSVNIDFEEMLKSEQDVPNYWNVKKEFINFIEDTLGLSIGSPEHGEISIESPWIVKFEGVEKWAKNVFEKQIKKKVKEDENLMKTIQRIQFKFNNLNPTIKIYKKFYPKLGRVDTVNAIKDIIESLGYKTNNIIIDY